MQGLIITKNFQEKTLTKMLSSSPMKSPISFSKLVPFWTFSFKKKKSYIFLSLLSSPLSHIWDIYVQRQSQHPTHCQTNTSPNILATFLLIIVFSFLMKWQWCPLLFPNSPFALHSSFNSLSLLFVFKLFSTFTFFQTTIAFTIISNCTRFLIALVL